MRFAAQSTKRKYILYAILSNPLQELAYRQSETFSENILSVQAWLLLPLLKTNKERFV